MRAAPSLPWTLTAYAQSYIKSDWKHYTKSDLEWSEALALAIDKFARDWIADNCQGKALAKDRTVATVDALDAEIARLRQERNGLLFAISQWKAEIDRLKAHFAKQNAQDVETNRRLQDEIERLRTALEGK